MFIRRVHIRFLLLLTSCLVLTACGTVDKVKYSALESVGIHKRDILVDRIEETTDAQEETRLRFQSAYEELSNLVEIDDDGLASQYEKLKKAVSRSENSAAALDSRISAVEKVANDLFGEWEAELNQYSSENLRRASQKNLASTQAQFAVIAEKMRASQAPIEPILKVLQDNTLYLKHNLNARAISALSTEFREIQGQVNTLIAEMESSISESQRFINQLRSSGT